MALERDPVSLDEFKARLPLADIVGRHVRLTRRGREHVGLCPFHKEKTPSFTVVESKGFYHCFGCGQHGNAIDFVMALEGLDFGQALARLADLTGIPAPRPSGGDRQPAPDRGLLAANEAAARWFAGRLESAAGEPARRYLAGRGVDAATIARFGIGYAPNERNALKRALVAEGYDERQLVAAGLLIEPEDGGSTYDRFRHRVTFPIHDARGRVVGFGGRALGDARAKYLNSPETPVFHKGELLYGLALARQAARERGTAVVVEGYMDVIALARAGFPNAVAPLGTALTEAQLDQLWRLADEPIICLDGDEAGLRAGHRLIERALPLLRPNKSLRFALLPRGVDPDDLVRARGRESLAARLREAEHYVEFLWSRETRHRNLSTPERRAALDRRFRELAGTISDRSLSRRFLEAMFRRTRVAFGPAAGRKSASRSFLERRHEDSVGTTRLATPVSDPAMAVERELIAPVILHPALLTRIEEEFATLEFAHPTFDALRQAIVDWYFRRSENDAEGLIAHLAGCGFGDLVQKLATEDPFTTWYGRDRETELVLKDWRARVAHLRRRNDLRLVRQAMSEAAERQDAAETLARRGAADQVLNRPGHDDFDAGT